MVQASQGFILTRHWHGTAAGIQIDLWLATDGGPVLVSLPPQQAVAFIPTQQQARTEALLNTDASVPRKQRPPSLRPLMLQDFHHHQPLLGLYCSHYRQLLALEKRLQEAGITVYEADIRPPPRSLSDGALYHRAGVVQRSACRAECGGSRSDEAQP